MAVNPYAVFVRPGLRGRSVWPVESGVWEGYTVTLVWESWQIYVEIIWLVYP